MSREFIGMAQAKVRYAVQGKVYEVGEMAPCTQREIDKGYFDGKTLKKGSIQELSKAIRDAKLKKKAVESADNKAVASPQTK